MKKGIYGVLTDKQRWIKRSKVVMCLLPVLFLLVTLWLSGMSSVQAASKDGSQKIPKPYFVKAHNQHLGQIANWKNFVAVGKISVPEPKIIRVAFQGEFEPDGSRTCTGNCPAQTLTCTGGSITEWAGCCMKCCNTGGCTTSCCQG